MMSANEAAQEAVTLLEPGFDALKLRLGHPIRMDIEVTKAVRAAIGESVELMVDYNQALTVPDAIRRGLDLQDMNIYWLEEQIRHNDLQGYAAIASELTTPIQLGENLDGPEAVYDAVGGEGRRLPHAGRGAHRWSERMAAWRRHCNRAGRAGVLAFIPRNQRASACRNTHRPLARIHELGRFYPGRAVAGFERIPHAAEQAGIGTSVVEGRHRALSRGLKGALISRLRAVGFLPKVGTRCFQRSLIVAQPGQRMPARHVRRVVPARAVFERILE